MESNDEVERRALTENEDALSQSFDYLLTSPKLRGRSNRLLGVTSSDGSAKFTMPFRIVQNRQCYSEKKPDRNGDN